MESLLYFLVLGGLVFLMMRFGCGAHVMGHGHGGQAHGRHEDAAPGGEARDPVCGMPVKTDTAKSSAFRERVYYFCSAACRDKFEAAPAKYATATPAHSREHSHGHC